MDSEAHSKSTQSYITYETMHSYEATRAYGDMATRAGRVRQPCVPSNPRSSSGSSWSQDFFAVFVSESFTHV